MPPHHPRGPKEKLLRRFYEPLVLLSVLDPTRDVIKPDLILDRGLKEQAKLWRNFLDQSSFLCDSAKGGDTVTAIAAQKTYEHSVFWLASNSNLRRKALVHYQWIISCLEQFCNGSTTDIETEKKIFDKCVEFSSKRITTYANWLGTAIDRAKRQKKDVMTPEDEKLFIMLQKIKDYMHDDHKLCTFAYECRSDESIHVLSKRHNAEDDRNVWSEIRHYIGRLGMWTKAVKVLILGARRFPHYIENAKVETIGPGTKADVPNIDHLTDLAGLIDRVSPKNDTATTALLTEALTDIDNLRGIWENFRRKYADITPRPHAELLVLEKFHHNKFEFLNGDRYIGCSKPSCYCCHLYIQCHPGHFAPRPCHGNLWSNWAPPISLPSDRDGKATSMTDLRLTQHHTFQMLQQMLVFIRRDLQEQILSRRPRREKLPDSSTGMSSVAIVSQKIHEGVATYLPLEESLTPSSSKPTSSEANFTDNDDILSSAAPDFDTRVISNSTEDNSPLQSYDVNSDSDSDDDEDILVFKGRR